MNSINTIILEGNIVRSPESKTTLHGSRVCTLPIAVNRKYKNQDGEEIKEVSFFNIETWGALADACEKYCPKGRGIRVVGRLKQDRWKSEEGKPHDRISIVAEHVEFKPMFNKNDTSISNSSNKNQTELKDLAEAVSITEQENNSEIPVF